MRIVHEELKKCKDWQGTNGLIITNPIDFYGRLTSKDLWRVIQKMDKEYKILHLFMGPNQQKAYQFDRQPLSYNETIGKEFDYHLNLMDGFDDFPKLILKESMPKTIEPEYFPFYMQIMFQAISELGITQDHQPAKKEIEGWFEDNYPDLSGNDVKALSTFVRHPSKKQGGWHSNSQKNKK